MEEVEIYKSINDVSKRKEMATDIISRYMKSGGVMELNISKFDKISTIEKFQLLSQTCPKNLFKEVEMTVKYTLKTDCYPKFLEVKFNFKY